MSRRISRSYRRRIRQRLLVAGALILLTALVYIVITQYYEEHRKTPSQAEILVIPE